MPEPAHPNPPDHATRVAQLDGLQRTIYVSGFAKILAPAWRIGYLAAPPALVEPLLDTKLLTTLTTPTLLERALAQCIEHEQLQRHAESMRARLAAARTRSVYCARAACCARAWASTAARWPWSPMWARATTWG